MMHTKMSRTTEDILFQIDKKIVLSENIKNVIQEVLESHFATHIQSVWSVEDVANEAQGMEIPSNLEVEREAIQSVYNDFDANVGIHNDIIRESLIKAYDTLYSNIEIIETQADELVLRGKTDTGKYSLIKTYALDDEEIAREEFFNLREQLPAMQMLWDGEETTPSPSMG